MGFDKYLHPYKYHHNQDIEHVHYSPKFLHSLAAVWHKKEISEAPIFKGFHFA